MIKRLSSLKLTITCLFILALLTILGTIYQVEHGLYLAQKNIFNSNFFLFHGLPLPSVKLVLIVLGINLISMMISKWRLMLHKPSLFLLHSSLIILLISSFINSISRVEAFINLKEAESSNIAKDYYNWDLSIFKQGKALQTITFNKLKTTNQISSDLTITVKDKFINSAIFDTPFAGRILKSLPIENDYEKNSPALILDISGKELELQGNDQDTLILKELVINLHRKAYNMPFGIKLIDVTRELYPGTQVAKSYQSKVLLNNNDNSREVLISMNKPLRFKDYTIYQSSYSIDLNGDEYSTFAIVKNPGYLIPYFATLLAAIGLWLHFGLMFLGYLKKRHLITATIITLSLLPQGALAAQSIDYQYFKQILVQDQGRLKPLDTFARSLLLRFSGKSRLDTMSHLDWFSKVIFEPTKINDSRVFLINNPEILESLNLQASDTRRYSFNNLRIAMDKLEAFNNTALNKPEKARSEFDREYMRIFSNLCCYTHLMNSLRFYFPDKNLHIEGETLEAQFNNSKNLSLFDLITHIQTLEKAITNIKPDQLKQLSSTDSAYINMAMTLFDSIEGYKAFSQAYPSNQSLNIIHNSNATLYTPWDNLIDKENKDKTSLRLLKDLYDGYHNNNFKKTSLAFVKYNHQQISFKQKFKMQLELIYNQINPLTNAKFIYGLAFLLIMISSLFKSNYFNHNLNQWLILTAFGLHSFALISRIIILERPPVSNLFETFVFVSWVTVIIGLVIERIDRRNIGLIIASFVALLLLLISSKFANEGDTMQVVIAVLNSNFWLSTHVICISIGYAGVFSAGIIGHIYLIKQLLKTNELHLKEISKMIYGVMAFGLCFSFLGTILGGIWADQSWGRFWGWDPKENGALLIVLWSTIMFHSKMAGLIKDRGFAIGSIMGSMVVILSWFGVNLLGVGLHSYGFTSGLAQLLIGYYGFEVLFVASTLIIARIKSR